MIKGSNPPRTENRDPNRMDLLESRAPILPNGIVRKKKRSLLVAYVISALFLCPSISFVVLFIFQG
jgi:hypothetical protein